MALISVLCPLGSSKFKSNQFLFAMIVSVFIFKVEITAIHFIDQSQAGPLFISQFSGLELSFKPRSNWISPAPSPSPIVTRVTGTMFFLSGQARANTARSSPESLAQGAGVRVVDPPLKLKQ